MKRCQIGDDRHKGNARALLLKQTQEDVLQQRMHGDDQVWALRL